MWMLGIALMSVGGFLIGVVGAALLLIRRGGLLTLANVHREFPWLAIASIGGIALIGFLFVAARFEAIGDLLPLSIAARAGIGARLGLALVCGSLAGFAATLAWSTHDPQRVTVTVLGLVMNAAVLAALIRNDRPIPVELGDRISPDGVVLQTSRSTCAAATLANLARLLGLALDERAAAAILGTTANGTSSGQIRYALSRLGLGSRSVPRGRVDLDRLAAPAFLFLEHSAAPEERHAVAFVGRRDEGYEIWDPAEGRVVWDAALAAEWRVRGAIECRALR
jgi:hypothetical protein